MNLYNDEKTLTIELDDELSSYQTKMIKNNLFDELILFNAEFKLECNVITYDVSNLISFDDLINNYNSIINRNEFQIQLKKLEEKIKEHMLNTSNVLIRKDTLYISKKEFLENNKFDFKFIYVPIKGEINNYNNEINLILNCNELFEYDRNKINFDNTEELLDKILSEDEIYDKKNNKNNIIKIVITILFLILLFLFRNNKMISIITFLTFIFSLLIMYFLKVTDDENEYENQFDEGTMIISNFPYLRKSILDERIYVNKNDFKIGKDKTNDFIINSNSVSRKHAHIIKRNNSYYIEDNNSTNHTFVNDEELKEGNIKMLLSGDKIKFGKEQYNFYYEV